MSAAAERKRRVGVVLVQLGGPDGPESVQPFLYNLFTDPDIIEIPAGWLLRRPLARFISKRRGPKVAEAYAKIGGRSPLRQLTARQARALETTLSAEFDARAFIAMRYWHPFTSEAVQALDLFAPDEIVLLPLYPQYSFATTGSSLNEWQRCFGARATPVRVIKEFYDHPRFIAAVVEKINLSLSHFDRREAVHLVFSAHGLPVSFIARGDPYQKQVELTVEYVRRAGGWSNPHTLCYQSKVGPQRWIEPSLHDTIERLGHDGVKDVLVVPIAFVSEHIETLYEINIEIRLEAEAHGIEHFEMMPAVGDSPEFIAALADLVRAALRA
jgi:ferrochelatase